MKTITWRIDYISFEGNTRWMTVEVLEGVTEGQIEEYSNCNTGMGDELCDFISTESLGSSEYFTDMCSEDWSHIEVY